MSAEGSDFDDERYLEGGAEEESGEGSEEGSEEGTVYSSDSESGGEDARSGEQSESVSGESGDETASSGDSGSSRSSSSLSSSALSSLLSAGASSSSARARAAILRAPSRLVLKEKKEQDDTSPLASLPPARLPKGRSNSGDGGKEKGGRAREEVQSDAPLERVEPPPLPPQKLSVRLASHRETITTSRRSLGSPDGRPSPNQPALGVPQTQAGGASTGFARGTSFGQRALLRLSAGLDGSEHDSGLAAAALEEEEEDDEFALTEEAVDYKLSQAEETRIKGAFLLKAKIAKTNHGEHVHVLELINRKGEQGALRDFTIAVVSLGFNLSETEVKQDFDRLKAEKKKKSAMLYKATGRKGPRPRLLLEDFQKYYIIKILGTRQEEKIRAAWEGLHYGTDRKTLDGKAYIYAVELQQILTMWGEPLTDEECSEMLRELSPDENDRIFYDQYRRMLLDKNI